MVAQVRVYLLQLNAEFKLIKIAWQIIEYVINDNAQIMYDIEVFYETNRAQMRN